MDALSEIKDLKRKKGELRARMPELQAKISKIEEGKGLPIIVIHALDHFWTFYVRQIYMSSLRGKEGPRLDDGWQERGIKQLDKEGQLLTIGESEIKDGLSGSPENQAKFDKFVRAPPAPSEPIQKMKPSPVYPSAKSNPTFRTPEDRAAEDK